MIILVVLLVLIIAVSLFMRQPQFGKVAAGNHLERIASSSNYREGKFKNLTYTPDLKEGVGYFTVMKDFLFNKSKRSRPSQILPSVKTNLLKLNPAENVLIWFGHSSYFIQLDGKKILVDP